MNCAEVQDLAPLYLSGEMRRDEHRRFAAHLAACPACGRELEQQVSFDTRLAEAVWWESPVTTRVIRNTEQRIERRVRERIGSAIFRRRWIAAAGIAACLIAVLVGSGKLRPEPTPRLYADAARDHRLEVVENRPRHWKSGASDIEVLAARNELSFAQAAALAPAGYSMEHAKTCGLDGQPMLHLVFSNGTRRYSVYVRPHQSAQGNIHQVRRDSEQVAGIETGHFSAVVVTVGPAAECAELARFAARRL